MTTEDDVLRQLEKERELNARLREHLFTLQANRVRMEGYLFKFKHYPAGLFGSAWEKRYCSLSESSLKCFVSDRAVAQIPETEIRVNGYALHWEGRKRKLHWIFGLKDTAGCVTLRLSTLDRTTAAQWMEALRRAGASGREAPKLPRIQSLPPRISQLQAESAHENMDTGLSLPDVVESPRKERTLIRRPMVGSTAVHTEICSSVLSSERLFRHPHPGLLNLGAVILVAANFRLVLENVFKYGIRVNPLRWLSALFPGSAEPLRFTWPVLAVCSLATLAIEKAAVNFLKRYESRAKKDDSHFDQFPPETAIVVAHGVNIFASLVLPLWLIAISVEAVMASFVLTMATVVVCMKLISYVHCNADLRRARILHEERDELSSGAVAYPMNVTLPDFLYFLVAPTLTYQTSYPRTERIRQNWLIRRFGELILALGLQLAIIDQYIFPAIESSMQTMENRDPIAFLERVLKLSLSVVYAWLIMFYIIFHLWLNILAEILRFGDREFYLDWWNALNLGDYWKTWNMPVHKWMLRTIYYPAIQHGLCRSVAMLLVFFVSASVHEILVTVPLKFANRFPWSFFGMMAQVPLILFSQMLQKRVGDRWGNIIFWVAFCVFGQPICLLNYYYDWMHSSGER